MKTDKYGRVKVNIEWNGLEVEGYVVPNDYEGDTSEPGLWRKLPPYVDEFQILSPTGSDMFDYLSEKAEEEICEDIINSFHDRGE